MIFDLDGTLIDSAPGIHAAINRMLAEEGEAGQTLSAVRGFIGNGVPTLIAGVIAAQGHAPDPARQIRCEQRFMTFYEMASADLTR